MSRIAPRRLLAILFGIAVPAALCFLPVSIAQGDDVSPVAARQPAARIAKGTVVQQEFPAAGTKIAEIRLILGTYERVNHGTFQVTIEAQRNGQWQPLASDTAQKETLGNSATVSYGLPLSQPLVVTPSERLRITVQSPDDGSQNAITWWMNDRYPQHEGFAAFVNGEPQSGTLCFSVTYPRASGRLIQRIGLAWERSTVFLNPGWRAALLTALGALLLGIFAAVYLLLATIGRAATASPSAMHGDLPPDSPADAA
jgi:hypothetical protein